MFNLFWNIKYLINNFFLSKKDDISKTKINRRILTTIIDTDFFVCVIDAFFVNNKLNIIKCM